MDYHAHCLYLVIIYYHINWLSCIRKQKLFIRGTNGRTGGKSSRTTASGIFFTKQEKKIVKSMLQYLPMSVINMNCLKCNSYLFVSLTAIVLCNCTLQLIQCRLYI